MNITIAVSEFQHENWGKAFFPEDLPEDWRFDYYANEFEAILFSETDLQVIGKESIAEMMAEANAEFLFILEDNFEGNESQYDTSAIDCGVLFVKFSSKKNIENISSVNSGIDIERAEIISQQNLHKTVCVLRVNSVRVIKNEDIKQILMHLYSNYSKFDQVCLFFGQRLQNVETINTARIINDLL